MTHRLIHQPFFAWKSKKIVLFLHLPEKKLLGDAQCASLHRTVYWRIAALSYVGRQTGSKKSTSIQLSLQAVLPVYPVLRIRDILLRIRILGSVPLTNGSRSRSCSFLSDLQDAKKKIFCLLFESTLTSLFTDKKPKRSHKYRNQGFLAIFAWWWEDPSPHPYR